MSELAGKTALITGASRGIGEAAAREFVAAGANVALVARNADAVADLAAELGDTAIAIPADVSSWDSVNAAVNATVEKFGGIDILVNNAGMLDPVSHLSTSTPADWDRIIDINVKGVYYGMRAAVPHMKANGGGTVLTVSSGAAHGPLEGWSHYCTSKAGAHMLTRCLDKEERDNGIRAIGLSPGTVATQMQREIKASGMNPVSRLNWEDHIPPEWPAKALVWMCSPAADPHLGGEISLRNEDIRREVGLIP